MVLQFQARALGSRQPEALNLRRGYATSCPPRQVNDSNKGSNGPAGSRSGKLRPEPRQAAAAALNFDSFVIPVPN